MDTRHDLDRRAGQIDVDDPGTGAPPDAEVLGHLQAFADVGFWEYDLVTGEMYLSTQVFQIVAIDEPSLDAYLAAVHPDDVELLRQVHLRARRQPGPYRVRHRTADGERLLQVRVQSVADATGTPVRYLGVISDVTAEWQLEQALEQSTSARLTGLLAGGVIHDLKNIFAIVLGHTHLATSAAKGGVLPAPESLAALERSAQRGLELTTQLLEIGQTAPVTARRVSVAELLGRVEVTAATLLGRHRDLHVDAGSGEADLVVDESRLERVLVDLLLNARDAMSPSEGSVRISFRALSRAELGPLLEAHGLPDGTYGVVEVGDDGSGISPDVLARVTDPFFTTKAATGGTGVGLHTVARFVESAGGVLRIDSEPGVGTTVRLVLPTRAAVAATAVRSRVGRVVVLSDDDRRLASLIRAFDVAGVQAVGSTSTAAAARLLRTEPIDVLLSDVATADDRPLLRLAAATSTPVLGVAEVVGSDLAAGPLPDGAPAEVVEAVERLLDRTPAALSGGR